MTTLSLTEARARFLRIAEQIDRDPDTIVQVTKRGRAVLTLLSAKRHAALVETLDILADTETMRRLEQSKVEARSGKTVPWKKAKKALGLE
jgi:PHD/YefM family antitoxin component YafN of YafNO toxin-antitoxin module